MKATLLFNLPEERCEHLVAVHAMDFALTCYEVDNKISGWLHHDHNFKTVDEALEAIRKELRDSLEDRGASLEMLE